MSNDATIPNFKSHTFSVMSMSSDCYDNSLKRVLMPGCDVSPELFTEESCPTCNIPQQTCPGCIASVRKRCRAIIAKGVGVTFIIRGD